MYAFIPLVIHTQISERASVTETLSQASFALYICTCIHVHIYMYIYISIYIDIYVVCLLPTGILCVHLEGAPGTKALSSLLLSSRLPFLCIYTYIHMYIYIHIYVYTYISSYASFLSCVSCADLRGRARDYSLELSLSPRVSFALYIFIYSHAYTYKYTHTHFVVCLLAICVLCVDLRGRARDYSLEFRVAFVTRPFALYIYTYVYMYTYTHTNIYIYISWYASLLSVSYVVLCCLMSTSLVQKRPIILRSLRTEATPCA